MFHNTFPGGGLGEFTTLLNAVFEGLPKYAFTWKGKSAQAATQVTAYDLNFPFWDPPSKLEDQWGLVVVFWQFNDLCDQQGRYIEPDDDWWFRTSEFIASLKFYKVGVVCGAEARLWGMDSRYDEVVAAVRRMLSAAGIPWFDGSPPLSAD